MIRTNVVKGIRKGYAEICEASTQSDAEKAYVDLHTLLEEERPSIDELSAIQAKDLIERADAQAAIKHALIAKIVQRPESIRRAVPLFGAVFRGIGTIALGNNEGEILTVSANYFDEDPVAERYPGYHRIAIRKLGQAALLGKSGPRKLGQYNYIEEVLRANDLLGQQDPPHYLGYDVMPGIFGGRIGPDGWVASGATGVLASPNLANYLGATMTDELINDYRRGYVGWQLDEFAGAIDEQAARSANLSYLSPHDYRVFREVQLGGLVDSIRLKITDGQNVH